MIARLLALGIALLSEPLAADALPDCPSDTVPVISLDFGSRYAEDSKTHSEFDVESDKAVTAALKPIDDFIAGLARHSDILNDPEADPAAAVTALECLLESIQRWADADALSNLASPGANLSAPSRVGGIAFAYAAVRTFQPSEAGNPQIEAWLLARARQTMIYFDTEAPPRASQNNLRAWAGLAVARIGLLLDEPTLIDWGAGSARLVACTASDDGSLPNEMWRGRLALHYQLHALAPLVTTAALLRDHRYDLFQVCDRAIPRVVRFTIAALADPAPVEEITGRRQSVGPKRPPRAFELAWAPAYLRFDPDPAVAALVEKVEKLGNSKLGGDQRLMWAVAPKPATAPPRG